MNALLALARADIVMYLSNRRALIVTLAAPILIAAFFGCLASGVIAVPLPVPQSNRDTAAIARLRAIALDEHRLGLLVDDLLGHRAPSPSTTSATRRPTRVFI
jgi:acyl-CoA synthetase (AMP-forming)/AMP-acid ligase II